jgi:hypothetical protein
MRSFRQLRDVFVLLLYLAEIDIVYYDQSDPYNNEES